MIDRNVDAMVKAIRHFELDVGEGFVDYFMDNWPEGSWMYWLLGQGYHTRANELINKFEKEKYLDQDEKFMLYEDYIQIADGGGEQWSEELYLKNVEIWAKFLVESDQYYRRVNEFFAEYDITQEKVNAGKYV